MKKNFYYKGKYFDTVEEFYEGVHKYLTQSPNENQIEDHFKELIENFMLNYRLWSIEMNNQEWNIIMEQIFIFMISLLNRKIEEKNETKPT